MAKTIGSYKGLWKHAAKAEEAATLPNMDSTGAPTPHAKAPPLAPVADPSPHTDESADLLSQRYRMLVLRDHRVRLGRDLLEGDTRDPWSLAWESCTTLGRSFRPWAHERIFALGCYLGVEMAPQVLSQLRHPLWIIRYRRSMAGLWRLLEILAQRTGQTLGSGLAFRLFHLCPPLGVLIYEKKLQTLLRQAGPAPVSMAPVKASSV